VNMTAVLAVIALALGILQLVHPLQGVSRISPQALFVIGALLGLRYAWRRESRKREEILKAVPRRPLGLDE
jgi:Flp pilus assembly protein TadB